MISSRPRAVACPITALKVSSEGITGVLVEAFDSLSVLRASAYTAADGSGTYVLSGLTAGSYRVQATWTADEIISSVGTDGITVGAINTDFTLEINYELASIGGELAGYRVPVSGSRSLAAGYRPLAAAAVELYQRNRLIATAPVDASGKFLIKNLLPGKYTLRLPDAGGGVRELAVQLRPGEALLISPLGGLLEGDSVYAYPNPAVNFVNFHVESGQNPIIKEVSVFDLAGREIREFKNADFVVCAPTRQAYAWEAVWNIPAGVAPGVYLYITRVKAEATGEYKKTVKKFAVVK